MSDYSYIDIHTHNKTSSEGIISIFNIDPTKPFSIAEDVLFTVGIHPWSVSTKIKSFNLDSILLQLESTNCIAIGEVGLDKVKKEYYDLQVDFFIKQLEIAKEKQMPIIIHCVKAYNEVINYANQQKYKGPIIFHDYNGNLEITKNLLKKNTYFSFGSKLFDKNSSGYKSLEIIPLDRIFLETDELNLSIQEIYKAYSEIKNIAISELKQAIHQNFSIFKR